MLYSSASSFQLGRKFAVQSEKENEIFEYVTGVFFFRLFPLHILSRVVCLYVCVSTLAYLFGILYLCINFVVQKIEWI